MHTIEIDGNTDLSQYIGRTMTFTTYEGETLTGTVESFESMRPVIRFADGRWAYGDAPVTERGTSELTFV